MIYSKLFWRFIRMQFYRPAGKNFVKCPDIFRSIKKIFRKQGFEKGKILKQCLWRSRMQTWQTWRKNLAKKPTIFRSKNGSGKKSFSEKSPQNVPAGTLIAI